MGGSGGRPVSRGAAGIVWAATLPDSGPTGGFFRDGKEATALVTHHEWILHAELLVPT